MALIGQISINMTTNAAAFSKGMKQAGQDIQAFGRLAGGLGTGAAVAGFKGLVGAIGGTVTAARSALDTMARFGLLAGGAAAAGIGKLVKAGSDLVENENKIKAVFGTGADTVIKASNNMASAFGVSKNEFQDAAGVFGGIFKNLGYGAEDTAKLSVAMVKLAADTASFKNIGFDEALQKIRAGISGESEPLKAIGVLISEDAVKREAVTMKIARQNQELNEQQKVQARLSLITKQLGDAQGDLAKTADDVANATRGVWGRIENLAAAIGEKLQPIAKSVLGDMSTALAALDMYWKETGNAAVDSAGQTIKAVGESTQSVGYLQKAIGFVADAWQTVKLGFLLVQSYVTEGISKLVEQFSVFGGVLDWIGEKFGKKLNAAEFFGTISKDLHELSDKQFKDFQTELAKPPASEGINEYFDKARQRTQELRKELAGASIDVSKITPEKKMAAKPSEMKFGAAILRGSQTEASTLLRSTFGDPRAKTAEQTADNTKRTADATEKMAASLANLGAASASMVDSIL